MNGQALPASTPAHPRGWHEFCELHAISTAKELARHYLRFATEHPHHDLLAAENFSVQFTDLFQQYFCHEVKEGIAMNQLCILPGGPVRDYRDTHRRHTDASLGTVATKAEVEPGARPEQQPVRAPEAAPSGLRKSWSSEELAGPARRPFSLSQLRRSWRSLFRRRSSDALPGDGDGEAVEAALKPGLGKRILPWGLSREQPPEVRKEGLLKYGLLDESSLDSGTRWQRCRLVLRRAGPPDAEDFVLELYDPPKGSKPKFHVACSAVQEVRRCTRLEMPDNLHTFVLKVTNATDILFEAGDEQQLNSWTAEIRECVRRGSDTGDPELLVCRHPDPVAASPATSTDPLGQAPAAGADGAGPVPGPAPPLLLHRGDAAPLPPLPHPAGVRHGLRRPALQLRRGPAPLTSSRLQHHGPSPAACPRLEPRVQPRPCRLLLPPWCQRGPPRPPFRADLPPGAAAGRAGAEPAPQQDPPGPQAPAPRVGLRGGGTGPGPRPCHRQPVHTALTGTTPALGCTFGWRNPRDLLGIHPEKECTCFFLLVRDDYFIFARKGVIFHSCTGVLPLVGLLKGLLLLFLLLFSKLSHYCLHTARACAPCAERRDAGLGLPPVPAKEPGSVLHPQNWRKVKKPQETKKKRIINSLTSCCSGPCPPAPTCAAAAKPSSKARPELSSCDGREQGLGFIFR
ncbi:SH2B adapter protein 3 isoform X2 [Manacus candei]|uniref:SH2B adapter protein 3 isoform X2 n=1 Tax=Manacus candei TaxID=415023 RepID=UPI00222808F4|nr:SH2B adapter protein 3 isoform X2 [Manacus candei]